MTRRVTITVDLDERTAIVWYDGHEPTVGSATTLSNCFIDGGNLGAHFRMIGEVCSVVRPVKVFTCRFCGVENLTWQTKVTGKAIPLDHDGTQHVCSISARHNHSKKGKKP